MRGDPQPLTDESDAIRRCQQGDIGALGALVTHYQTPAVRLAYLLTGDHDLANDIAQDSFLLAWRGIQRFRLGEPFAPWFFRIVTNCARQQMRSARYRREVSLDALVSDDPHTRRLGDSLASAQASRADPEERAERAEAWAALLAALATLPQKQREAVVLRYYLGYPDKQAAMILGCRVGALQQRLHDGRASLQRAIRTRYPWLLNSLPTLSPSEP
ncbi:MAG: RNA polymerase sigma factor [Chloroflexota bacterium]|nr:RNA polymerase sigma factor [Chloroflexota bacterium]